MENRYKKALENIKITESEFIRACLADIKGTICRYPLNRLDFGNTSLKLSRNSKGEECVFVGVNVGIKNEGFVELYSEDGYESIEDIAHWADIVADVDKCYKSGRKSYTIDWNK